MSSELSRREFFKRSGALSVMGAATPWAVNLAAMGEAAAQSTPSDYKALVCVFLFGGNDYGNTIIPYDQASYDAYLSIRGGLPATGGLAIARDAVLASNAMSTKTSTSGTPFAGQQFSLTPYVLGTAAPTVNPLLDVFNNERLAVLFNTGTLRRPTTKLQYVNRSVPLPPKLFSHNDQQSFWQSSKAEGSVTGWGGRMGDLFAAGNGTASNFTAISVSGNAVYLAGESAVQYQVSSSGSIPVNGIKAVNLFSSNSAGQALRTIMTTPPASVLGSEYASISSRSISANETMTAALSTSPGNYAATFDSTNPLMGQLKLVARMIQARGSLNTKRQVFFVSLGGFDTHDTILTGHPVLQQKVADALKYFDATLGEIGARDMVTTFTASDFGRTLTGNGNGSDHGWGSHHFVMGGMVKGKEFYGKPPNITTKDGAGAYLTKLGTGGPDDVGQGRLLPSTSVDQLAATLATWFGVSATDLNTVLPQISEWNVSDRNLGFMR